MPPQLPVGVCIVAVVLTDETLPYLQDLLDVAVREGLPAPTLKYWNSPNSPGKRLMLLEFSRMPCDDEIPPEQSALWLKLAWVLPPALEIDVMCMRGRKSDA